MREFFLGLSPLGPMLPILLTLAVALLVSGCADIALRSQESRTQDLRHERIEAAISAIQRQHDLNAARNAEDIDAALKIWEDCERRGFRNPCRPSDEI